MKLKHLFFINIFFAVFFGVSCTFFAGWVTRLYGLAPEIGSLWARRRLTIPFSASTHPRADRNKVIFLKKRGQIPIFPRQAAYKPSGTRSDE
ncbi:hypothetical protein EH223_09160 [candidate division KSB1 bacterium]|nr:hypothetical protein [Candidatus Aminicenantes bacterium]RQW03550.1 MAG: hypothetical protein EH223_09160 [candidate division KSB1 bacterium]